MPVTKSAKKALRVDIRRHKENLIQKSIFKSAIKAVKKAVEAGGDQSAELFSKAQSALDKAAKKNTIHPNKAARLKSRLAKRITNGVTEVTPKKAKAGAKKAAPKKKTSAKKK